MVKAFDDLDDFGGVQDLAKPDGVLLEHSLNSISVKMNLTTDLVESKMK